MKQNEILTLFYFNDQPFGEVRHVPTSSERQTKELADQVGQVIGLATRTTLQQATTNSHLDILHLSFIEKQGQLFSFVLLQGTRYLWRAQEKDFYKGTQVRFTRPLRAADYHINLDQMIELAQQQFPQINREVKYDPKLREEVVIIDSVSL